MSPNHSASRGFRSLLVMFLCACPGSARAADPLPGAPPPLAAQETHRVLVRFRTGAPPAAVQAAHRLAGATPLRRNAALGVTVAALPPGADASVAARIYLANPAVQHAEPDTLHFLHFTPSDSLYANAPADPRGGVGPRDHQRWTWDGTGIDRNLDAEAAWDRVRGRADVVVAVVDSGVDLDQPDLAENIWTNPGEVAGNGLDDDGNGFIDDVHGYDFADDDPDPDPSGDSDGIDNDGNGYIDDGIFHGTFVAGLIAAKGDDGYGMAGAAWGARVMALRIFDDDGGAFLSDIIDAITYAADMGAHVANYSFGSSIQSKFERDAVNYAHARGVVQVASAGNGNSSSRSYPAAFSHVISVGASDHGSDFVTSYLGTPQDIDGRAPFSQYGTRAVDVVAPGRLVLSTLLPASGRPNENLFYLGIPDGTGVHALASGTSFSAPIVAGLAALIISRDLDIDGIRDLSNDAVETHIETYTVDLPDDPDDSPDGGSSWDGKGRVSFRLAIEALGGPVDSAPTVVITSPPTGSCFGTGTTVHLSASASDLEDGELSAGTGWTSSIDGFLGTGASIDAVLSDGEHTVSASVTDSAGQSGADAVAISIGPAPPIADAGPDQVVTDAGGDGIETVVLDGTASTDTCSGTIALYEWFESGVLIATGPSPSVDFPLGSYTVTLVVTDGEGLTDSDSVSITVQAQPAGPTQALVQCVRYDTSGGRNGDRHLAITILVLDDLGNPVAGATVAVDVTRDGSPYATGSGTTGSDGRITFNASNAPSGCYTTTVTDVSASGLVFEGSTPANSFCKGTEPAPEETCR